MHCFDLLRNSRLTVPMYAYRREIPCLPNFLDRLSACQKGFLTRWYGSLLYHGLPYFVANGSNFDRNRVRGCNFGSEGGAFSMLGGCSLIRNIKELQISLFSASNAAIFPSYHPTLCWNRRTLSAQFRFQYLSASFSYSGWYAQGLPRSP